MKPYKIEIGENSYEYDPDTDQFNINLGDIGAVFDHKLFLEHIKACSQVYHYRYRNKDIADPESGEFIGEDF